MKLAALIAAYVLAMAGSNLMLKLTSQAQGVKWWVCFVLANAVGFLCAVVMPFALKLAPSNVVYAVAIGAGFCVLQLGAFFFFREPLTVWQWTGVAFVAAGLVLLQMKAS